MLEHVVVFDGVVVVEEDDTIHVVLSDHNYDDDGMYEI